MTRYREATEWRRRENTKAQAMMALFVWALVARRGPTFALAILERAVANAAVLKGPRGEANEVARALLDFAGKRAASQDQG